MPVEDQIPVEAAHLHRLNGRAVQLECVVVDDLDEGHRGHVGIARDRIDQRLQPALGTLAVRVQEDENFAGGDGGALQPRSDQALPLLHTHLL